MKKIIGHLLGWVLLFASPAVAYAEETLVLHHFLSPQAPTHADFLVPWAEKIEKDSGGALKIKIYPSMALGGKPPELYRQLRDGVVDIAWTVMGYTPGVFPRSEVFELPSVHRGSAEASNQAIQEVYDEMLADDFGDVHPILVHVHGGNAMHLKDKPVSNVADLRGLKIRTPSRTGAWMIESWLAEPVGMPLPALPQALSKGAVEGALIPFEVVRPYKVHELTDYSVEGDVRFGTLVFLFAMNKERYNALSPKLRAVIDDNTGSAIAAHYGRLWDGNEEAGRQAQIDSGGKIVVLDAASQAGFAEKAKIVEERWIKGANAAGLDGEHLVKTAKKAIAKYSH